jgi:hypothetical protein
MSVRVSAGMLLVSGFILALQSAAFFFLMDLFMIKHSAVGHRTQTAAAFAAIIFAALSYLCIRGASALYRGRRWGAYVGTAMGSCLLALSAPLVFDYLHPERQSADEYFAIFPVPFFIALGM